MMPKVRSMSRLNRTAHCVLSLRPRSSRAWAAISDLGELGLDERRDQGDDDGRNGHRAGDDDRRLRRLAQAALVTRLRVLEQNQHADEGGGELLRIHLVLPF